MKFTALVFVALLAAPAPMPTCDFVDISHEAATVPVEDGLATEVSGEVDQGLEKRWSIWPFTSKDKPQPGKDKPLDPVMRHRHGSPDSPACYDEACRFRLPPYVDPNSLQWTYHGNRKDSQSSESS
jgi:hypothetical protein